MSNRPSRSPSPLNSPKSTSSSATPVVPGASNQPTTTSEGHQHFAETPQSSAGLRSQSTPNLPITEWELQPTSSNPAIIVTGSPVSRQTTVSELESVPRQGRPLVSGRRSGSSSTQPPRRSSTPYSRPRSRSQPREVQTTTTAMSSASSSPGNTSTAGSTSGSSSNPAYNLPYAPFPYPMPANGRGSGQSQQGSGSGK